MQKSKDENLTQEVTEERGTEFTETRIGKKEGAATKGLERVRIKNRETRR